MLWLKAYLLNAMLERLRTMRAALQSGSALSKSEKQWLKENYRKATGVELKTVKGCTGCWMDGVSQLIIFLSKDTLRLRSGAVIEYNGKVYNKHTITAEITQAVLKDNPELKHLFY